MSIVDKFVAWCRKESGRLPYLGQALIKDNVLIWWNLLKSKITIWRDLKVVRVGFLLTCVPCLLIIMFQIKPVRAKIGQYWGSSKAMASTSVKGVIGVGGVDERLLNLEMRYGSDQTNNDKLKAKVEELSAQLKASEIENQVIYAQFIASTSGVEKLAAEMDRQIDAVTSLIDQAKTISVSSGSSGGSSSNQGGVAVTTKTTNSSSSGSGVSPAINSKININTADKDALMTLSGVGESKAQAILDYRTTNGAFKSIADLDNVKGIGAAMIEDLKDKITL